jgi:hypothetical protein
MDSQYDQLKLLAGFIVYLQSSLKILELNNYSSPNYSAVTEKDKALKKLHEIRSTSLKMIDINRVKQYEHGPEETTANWEIRILEAIVDKFNFINQIMDD